MFTSIIYTYFKNSFFGAYTNFYKYMNKNKFNKNRNLEQSYSDSPFETTGANLEPFFKLLGYLPENLNKKICKIVNTG